MLRAVDARSGLRGLLIAGLGMIAMPSRGVAQTAPPPTLGQLSIEDLMSVEVTSASRKQQRTVDVAAAVFVITHEDIQRSGLTTIPDLLRLVPGVNVAMINANRWAVSVRGFNDLYSNKLLVLVDGRSVYNRLFSGVLWDSQDVMLDDVERIEVIRGPGAALWGANAVNGVINIVTKTATETRGLLARASAGTQTSQAVVRYGGGTGVLDYRIFAQWTDRQPSLMSPGVLAKDPSQQLTGGFRVDRLAGGRALMFEGGVTASRLHSLWTDLDPQARTPISDALSRANASHLVGRWIVPHGANASFQLQSFVDVENRTEPVGKYSRRVVDIDAQYRMRVGGHQDVVAGGGYRFTAEGLGPSIGISLVPADNHVSLTSLFVQDEVTLLQNRLAVTLAAQTQYDSGAGWAVQPTTRVMWKLRPNQRVWAAASHALRTPSLTDTGIRVEFPAVPTAAGLPLVVKASGNPAIKSEEFADVEAGYRREWGSVASVDITAFTGSYDALITTEVAAPVLELAPVPRLVVMTTSGNQERARTRGVEIVGHWMPSAAWRLDGSYSAFNLTPELAATSTDADNTDDGAVPTSQWQITLAFSPSTRASFYAAIGHVGRLRELEVDAYTRADLTAELRLSKRLTVMAIGQNLLDASHAEHSGNSSLIQSTQVPRSFSVRVRWAIR